MFTLVLFLAVICTKIVEAVFEPVVEALELPRKLLLFLSLMVGVALALFTSANIFAIVGVVFEPGWVAVIVTGILIGGSGSVIHDVVKAWEGLGGK